MPIKAEQSFFYFYICMNLIVKMYGKIFAIFICYIYIFIYFNICCFFYKGYILCLM